MPQVRDDPESPDPAFSDLYGRLPDALDLEPWLSLARSAQPPVLYLGAGAGRLAVPLNAAGVQLVCVDAHPGMVARLRSRLPSTPVHLGLIESFQLSELFDLVIVPSNILCTEARLRGAARHLGPGGKLAFELTNPHWLVAGAAPGFRVLDMDRDRAAAEISYPGGDVQLAEIPLIWPEAIEDFLAGAGLELVRIDGQRQGEGQDGGQDGGQDEVAGLDESPTFYTVSRRPGSGS